MSGRCLQLRDAWDRWWGSSACWPGVGAMGGVAVRVGPCRVAGLCPSNSNSLLQPIPGR